MEPSRKGAYNLSLFNIPFCIILSIAFGISAIAAESAPDLDQYSQTKYSLNDPVSDEALVQGSYSSVIRLPQILSGRASMDNPNEKIRPVELRDLNPEYCKTNTFKDQLDKAILKNIGYSEQENETKNLSAQGRENPIRGTEFGQMLIEVINEERKNGIEPSLGTVHTWSAEYKKSHRLQPVLMFSKLFVALAKGVTYKYMVTGKEDDLLQWMLKQPKNSIEPAEMFRQSYRLNHGDVYLTLLSIENVLARHWHYPDRENLPQTQKLMPITSGFQYEKDRFGTWYHLFGMMLFGYADHPKASVVIGRAEALGSKILTPSDDNTQKAWMNKDGGPIGADLKTSLTKKLYTQQPMNTVYLDKNRYLNSSEDFRSVLPIKPTPGVSTARVFSLPASKNLPPFERIEVSLPGPSLKNCTVRLLFDYGSGYTNSNAVVLTGQSFEKGTPKVLPWQTKSQSTRGFIDGCDGQSSPIVFENK